MQYKFGYLPETLYNDYVPVFPDIIATSILENEGPLHDAQIKSIHLDRTPRRHRRYCRLNPTFPIRRWNHEFEKYFLR